MREWSSQKLFTTEAQRHGENLQKFLIALLGQASFRCYKERLFRMTTLFRGMAL